MPTTTPAVQAKTKTTSIEKPEQTLTKTRPEPVTWLNFTQDCMMIDLLADLVTRGGARRNLGLLVEACLDHQWRLNFPQLTSSEKGTAEARRWTERHFDEWNNRLVTGIEMRKMLRRSGRKGESPTPKSVSQRIRQNYKERLEGWMESFLREAEPEEIRLMIEILEDREAIASWDSETVRDIPIATSFDRLIRGDRAEYLRVPEDIRDDVVAYANALLKTRDGKVA